MHRRHGRVGEPAYATLSSTYICTPRMCILYVGTYSRRPKPGLQGHGAARDRRPDKSLQCCMWSLKGCKGARLRGCRVATQHSLICTALLFLPACHLVCVRRAINMPGSCCIWVSYGGAPVRPTRRNTQSYLLRSPPRKAQFLPIKHCPGGARSTTKGACVPVAACVAGCHSMTCMSPVRGARAEMD